MHTVYSSGHGQCVYVETRYAVKQLGEYEAVKRAVMGGHRVVTPVNSVQRGAYIVPGVDFRWLVTVADSHHVNHKFRMPDVVRSTEFLKGDVIVVIRLKV